MSCQTHNLPSTTFGGKASQAVAMGHHRCRAAPVQSLLSFPPVLTRLGLEHTELDCSLRTLRAQTALSWHS